MRMKIVNITETTFTVEDDGCFDPKEAESIAKMLGLKIAGWLQNKGKTYIYFEKV